MTRITIDNARELLNSDKLLVMLYGPTEHSKLEPVVEEVSHEYEGRINVGICSLLIQDDIAIDFDIRGYPSLLFFKKANWWADWIELSAEMPSSLKFKS